MSKEAMFYHSREDQKVECRLCPHDCLIDSQKYGKCGVRFNDNGFLQALTYGQVSALHLDPIEKKPLYHYYPGSQILSLGSYGCNLHCSFCQNYEISQESCNAYVTSKMTPEYLVVKALENTENIGLAYTYNEPTVFYEMMYDTAVVAKEHGLLNVVVSNGYINTQPLEKLLTVIDCFNIDLKSFSNDFYTKVTGGRLSPVLRNLKLIRTSGAHLEITFLLIPELNDDAEQFSNLVNWIHDELGSRTVLHISRYFPHYKLNIPATPISQLTEFYNFAKTKLDFVYLGNVAGEAGCNTNCPVCNHVVVRRKGYSIDVSGLDGFGKCRFCGDPILQC